MDLKKDKPMKLLQIGCILFLIQVSLQAQTGIKQAEIIIRVNAESSTKVTDNSLLSFYTFDEIKLENIVIPINTVFSATVRLIEGRAYLRVGSIKIRDEIYAIDWRAIGPDNNEGLPIISYSKSFEVYENQRLTFKVFSN